MNTDTAQARIWPLIASMCVAEALSMLGFANYFALLPDFVRLWDMTNTEAGWIGGVFFAGYMGAVPVLVGLTDRIDPRRIYLLATAIAGVSSLAFAFLADGFWSALGLRLFAGVGLAGTYMPGLKILADRIQGPRQSRSLAFYTSCFSVGAAASFLVSGEVMTWLGWRWVFGVSAIGSLLAACIVLTMISPGPKALPRIDTSRLLDFRPVLRNRKAMGFILGYGVHAWELFGVRAWIVAFLVFSQELQPAGTEILLSATVVATLVSLAGVPASIIGNEFAIRFGRVRVAVWIGLISAAMACVVGFAAPLPYMVVVILLIVYGTANYADSSTLTAGTVAAAEPGRSGATMAVHSFSGFAGGFMAPLVLGVILDHTGGRGDMVAWGLAFASLGIVAALGPVALTLLSRERD